MHKAAGPGEAVSRRSPLLGEGRQGVLLDQRQRGRELRKSALVGPGKLKSTDGVYGIRFAHNTDGLVTGLTVTK